jgi:hypothetical protein
VEVSAEEGPAELDPSSDDEEDDSAQEACEEEEEEDSLEGSDVAPVEVPDEVGLDEEETAEVAARDAVVEVPAAEADVATGNEAEEVVGRVEDGGRAEEDCQEEAGPWLDTSPRLEPPAVRSPFTHSPPSQIWSRPHSASRLHGWTQRLPRRISSWLHWMHPKAWPRASRTKAAVTGLWRLGRTGEWKHGGCHVARVRVRVRRHVTTTITAQGGSGRRGPWPIPRPGRRMPAGHGMACRPGDA